MFGTFRMAENRPLGYEIGLLYGYILAICSWILA